MTVRWTRRVTGIYLGWWLALGTCVSLAMVAGLTFWSLGLFVDPLQSEFGWSRSLLGGAVSLSLLISGFASPLVGRLVIRYKPRSVIAVGSFATGACYVLLAHVQQLWQFILLLGLVAFFRAWIFYVPFTTLINRWFSRQRATALGIATSGFGVGGLVFLPLLAEVLSLVGWRATFLVCAVLVLAVNGVISILFGNDPPQTSVDRAAIAVPNSLFASEEQIDRYKSVQEIYRSPIFWFAATGFGLFFFGQWAFLYHAPQLLISYGLSERSVALVLGVSAGIGVLVRLASGPIIDRLKNLEILAAGVLGVMAIALMVLAIGSSILVFAAFAVLWGIGSGLGPALEPMLAIRLFGSRHYALAYGALDGADTVVSIPGPWLGGIAYDTSGSYAPVLLLYTTAFVVGALAFSCLPRLSRQDSARAHHVAGEVVEFS
jgi:sugar phosphate permease